MPSDDVVIHIRRRDIQTLLFLLRRAHGAFKKDSTLKGHLASLVSMVELLEEYEGEG